MALLVGAGAGCGGSEPVGLRLRRVPTLDPDCALSGGGNTIRIRAIGDFPVTARSSVTFPVGEAISIGQFTAQLEGVAVEVFGASSDPVAIGRSAQFAFDDLADGDEVPVYLAPEDGACELRGLERARMDVRAVVLGRQVLVLGGRDADGAVGDVELFDPDQPRSQLVDDDHYGNGERGFAGASLTTFGDRAVAAGGPATAWQLWREDGSSDGPQFLPEGRAFHAAVALDDHRLFLAAGCAQVTSELACDPATLVRSTTILDVDTGELSPGPRLELDRIGGSAFVDVDGTIVVVGGSDGDGVVVADAERIDLATGDVVRLVDAPGSVAAQLASGSVVVGFSGAGPDGVSVIPATGLEPHSLLGIGAPLASTLTEADDGSLIAIGAAVARYRPIDGAVLPLDVDLGGPRSRHGAVRLPDGSLLVLGGADGEGNPRADVWRLRPPLRGPLSNDDLTVRFGDLEVASPWVPRDPAQVVRVADPSPHAEIEGGEVAVLAGPRYRAVTMNATVAARTGVSLLLGFDRGRGWRVDLDPGRSAAAVELLAGSEDPLVGCDVEEVVADADLIADDGAPVTVTAVSSPQELSVRSGDRLLLRCRALGTPPLGYVGFGVAGGADRVRVDALTVSRRLP